MFFYVVAIIAVPLVVGLVSLILAACMDSGAVSRMEEAEPEDGAEAVREAERILAGGRR